MMQSLEEYGNIGIQTNTTEDWMKVTDIFLNTFFILELLVRVGAHQGQFCAGQDWKWNLFDAIMVCASLLELGLLVSFNLSYIRLLRVLRVARSLRMIHLIKFPGLRNLRLMLMAIIGSAVPLLWAGLVLVILMFFFGVIFLNGVADYTAEASLVDPNVDVIRTFFPTLLMTLLTLFMCITGGVNWWEVQRLLLDISVAYALLFILFVLVTVLAAMNVITGIFVNDAVEMASLDSDNKVQQEMDQNRHYLQKLLELFQKIDTTHRGSITLETFLQQMQQEEVKLNFAMLGLDVSDPMAFFSLLDVDGSVELEIDEFVMGCMRFRNNPGNVNLECSVLEAKQLMVKSLARQKRIQDRGCPKTVVQKHLPNFLCEEVPFPVSAPPEAWPPVRSS